MTKQQFTDKEIGLIWDMLMIAEANVEGEGDYQEFDYVTAVLLKTKIKDMTINRKRGA